MASRSRSFPYLVAMLAAISIFRTTGAWMSHHAIRSAVLGLGLDDAFVPALPVGLMKTLSGKAVLGA